jgi:hypothetical protein
VDELLVTGDRMQVRVRNQGDRAVTEAFWVDVYIDPDPLPAGVNQTWSTLASQGMVWGVTAPALPLSPGQAITLTSSPGDVYFRPDYSQFATPFSPDMGVYAQADSANMNTSYGAILENHEASGGAYNNISGVASVAISSTPLVTADLRDGTQPFDRLRACPEPAEGAGSATDELPPRSE